MDNPKIDNTQQIAKATTEIRPCGGPSGMDMALPGDGDVALAPGMPREGSARYAAEGMSRLTGGQPTAKRKPAGGR